MTAYACPTITYGPLIQILYDASNITRTRELTLIKDVMLLMCSMVLIRSSYEIILISITDNLFFDNRTGYSDDLMCSRIRLF